MVIMMFVLTDETKRMSERTKQRKIKKKKLGLCVPLCVCVNEMEAPSIA